MNPGEIAVEHAARKFRVYPREQRALKDLLVARSRARGTDVWALRDVSFHVEPGSAVGLVGRNGSGKTTLLRVINGFVRPAHGHVRFRGITYVKPDLPTLAGEGLFFIPERDLLTRGRRLDDHIELLLRRYPWARADDVIRRLRLGPCLARPPERLSGGERRRAELGLAMIRKPACLLADEPFMGVEPREAEGIAVILRAMARDGCAILVTGHEIQAIFSVSDEIQWLTAGTIYPLGSPSAAARHEGFRREYLGPRGLRAAGDDIEGGFTGTATVGRGT